MVYATREVCVYRSISLAASGAHYSAGVWTVDRQSVGYRLDATMAAHQVSMSGLDGGTFSVDLLLPSDPTWKSHATGATEADTVIIGDPLIVMARITVASLGGSAAPVAHFTSRPRGFAS